MLLASTVSDPAHPRMTSAGRREHVHSHVTAFLDTNIFLHFLPFDDVDWRKELTTRAVHLRIASVVIKELNKRKDGPGVDHVRDRARKTLRRIREVALQGSGRLKESVHLSCEGRPAVMDLRSRGLDPDWQDDCILASVIEFKEQNPAEHVVLVTDDPGAALRAHTYGVASASLSDELRIPPQPDQKQERIRELEGRLREVEKGLPKLEIAFADGRLHGEFPITPDVSVTVADAAAYVETHIAPQFTERNGRTWQTLAVQAKEQDGISEGLASLMQSVGSFAELMAMKASSDVAMYLHHCRDYLVALQRYRNESARIKELPLVLRNVGTVPAEEINIVLCVPKAVGIFPTGRLPAPPFPPVPPGKKPVSGVAPAKSAPLQTSVQYVRGLDMRDHWELTYRLQRLNHHLIEPLIGLHIHFRSYEAAEPFRIDYRLAAVNAPGVVTGFLNIVPRKSPPLGR
jgi:hypothetical protein